ncbi:MAG: hypothetical protein JWN14_37, partial [Chthonomonadales bacterium]|nr:hypothetical protein [Chthonomonadales bacterium]
MNRLLNTCPDLPKCASDFGSVRNNRTECP